MATKKLFYVNVTSPEGTSTYYARDDLWRLELSPERLDIVENVVAAIASYLSEVAKLVASSDKLASSLPSHLSEPGLVIVTCTPEGIIVRYDKQQIDEVVGTWSDSDLKTIVPHISENYVHCIASGEELDANTPMLELRSVIVDSDGQSREIGGVKTGLIVELPLRERPTLMNRPNRSVQVSDTLMIEMHGVAVDTGTPEKDWDKGQPFIAKSSVRLPLKWNALEIYLPYQSESWELDQTPQWALQEILLFQSIRNLDEVRNHAIDPLFTARNHFIQLLSEFDEVLESAENEEQIQVFLTSHPELLEPAFKKVWPKFTLGPYVTDYVFEGAMGDYLLVELEHSSKQLFIKNGNQSAPLTQAIGQTVDWVRFIEDNLSYCRIELGLTNLGPNPKRLVVIGRSKDLTGELERKLATINHQTPNLQIITYDHLRAQAAQTFENIVGPLNLADQPGETKVYFPNTRSLLFPVR